ncbi:transmembrane protein 242 [Coccinella septempunctata]|uniref:transmembrane protein 242 n=1 Tax=Coccinella septempunctata TaxID=41139 RepID=UPI001D0959B8|nr:transmembrane protein 242 [Coccinella septempunctata]
MTDTNSTNLSEPDSRYSKEFRWKAGLFLGSVTGISALVGFGTTIAAAKRKDPEFFNKGMIPTSKVVDSGSQLALRALGWGTLYACTGCGLLFYSIWKLSGANNMQEFRNKMGSLLPKIPKNNPPIGRTEFSGLNDLLDYVQHLKSAKDK